MAKRSKDGKMRDFCDDHTSTNYVESDQVDVDNWHQKKANQDAKHN